MTGERRPIGSFGLPPTTTNLYRLLAGNTDTDTVQVTLSDLSRRAGVSITTAQKHLVRLEQCGAVTVTRNGKRPCVYQLHADPDGDVDVDLDVDEHVSIAGGSHLAGLGVRLSALRMPISVAALGCYMRLLDLDMVHEHNRFPMTLRELCDLCSLDDLAMRRVLTELWAVDMVDFELIDNNSALLVSVDVAPDLDVEEAASRLALLDEDEGAR